MLWCTQSSRPCYRRFPSYATFVAPPPRILDKVCLDHFQGNRTPFTDPLSRGALAGLTLKHGKFCAGFQFNLGVVRLRVGFPCGQAVRLADVP